MTWNGMDNFYFLKLMGKLN